MQRTQTLTSASATPPKKKKSNLASGRSGNPIENNRGEKLDLKTINHNTLSVAPHQTFNGSRTIPTKAITVGVGKGSVWVGGSRGRGSIDKEEQGGGGLMGVGVCRGGRGGGPTSRGGRGRRPALSGLCQCRVPLWTEAEALQSNDPGSQ